MDFMNLLSLVINWRKQQSGKTQNIIVFPEKYEGEFERS